MTIKLKVLSGRDFELDNSILKGYVRIGSFNMLIRIGNDGIEDIITGERLQIVGIDLV